MRIRVRVGVFVIVDMIVIVIVDMTRIRTCRVLVIMRQVNVKLHSGNRALVTSRKMQVIAIQIQGPQPFFQVCWGNAQVHQGPDKHVAADPAEKVEVQSFHPIGTVADYSSAAKALIWLAA